MAKTKKYTCGYGEGMFEDKDGHWIEYSVLESKIDSHIKWCEENIENLTIRDSPVQTAINIHPYQQFIRLLKQLK